VYYIWFVLLINLFLPC